MSLFKALKSNNPQIIHDVFIVDAPFIKVAEQLTLWFEGVWRPSGALLHFTCDQNGPVTPGATCRGEFKKIITARWNVTVERIEPNHFLECTLSGFFKGREAVYIEERDNGIKVDYKMSYQLNNPIYQIIWSLFMEETFVTEVRQNMQAFKTYCQRDS